MKEQSISSRKKVGIYRKAAPRSSESFIEEQAGSLKRYEATFVVCNLLKEIQFESVSLCSGDSHNLRQLLYLLTRSPSLFHSHEQLRQLSLIHAHFGIDGVYAMALAAKLGIPFLVTFHGYDITASRRFNGSLSSLLYQQLNFYEKQLQEKAAAFIAVSKFIQKKLIEKGYPDEKIIQHYIGVDVQKFFPTSSKGNERYILCVGRHTEKKGIDTLIRAFS